MRKLMISNDDGVKQRIIHKNINHKIFIREV